MAAQHEVSILLGKESTYGTPATLTDAFEGQADSYKFTREYIDSVGFRAGMETLRSDRRIDVDMGGEGSLELDVLSTGFGFLLESMFGSVAGPVQQAATAAYLTTATTTSGGPSDSYTIQVQRVDVSGAQRDFTHHGGVVTGWGVSHEVGGLLKANLAFDFEDVDTSTGSGTPAYAAGNVPFDWTQAKVSLDGVDTAVTSLSLDADLKMKTDRRFLRQSSLKKQPVPTGLPEYTGAVSMEFEGLTEYADFESGAVFEVVYTFTGANIEAAHDYEIVVTMPACQYTGSSPVSSLSDVATLELPFKVLDNGTDPAITLTYMSTDTSL